MISNSLVKFYEDRPRILFKMYAYLNKMLYYNQISLLRSK